MRPSLQLRIGQQLTMTPQLQQAIRLLQLSTLELQQEVQTVLDSNLMLEMDEEQHEQPEDEAERETSRDESKQEDDEDVERELTDNDASEMPDELPVDSVWDDVYESYDGSTSLSKPDDSAMPDIFENRSAGGASLKDHLQWQLELTRVSDTDREIAETIIDAVNEDGYLTQSLDEIYLGLDPSLDVDLDEVEAVLHLVQRFDPTGVAARDPGECLLLQLEDVAADTPWLTEARTLLRNHLENLSARDYNQIMRRMKVSRDDLMEIMALIQTLNPRPGSDLPGAEPQYVIPDAFVYKRNGTWRVELNAESSPKLRVNPFYAGLVKRADTSADNQTMRNHLQEARWFLKSLQNRNETLLKVAACIVERQRGFLEEGDEAMKPLVLRDVAENVEMHESTVSRVTTQKYLHTPRGIFEFKYFFSSHVSTSDGGECSSTAIRAMIRKLVAEESPQKPLSDSKIAEILKGQGIQVARRTVAKYREAMSIPSSTERKRLA